MSSIGGLKIVIIIHSVQRVSTLAFRSYPPPFRLTLFLENLVPPLFLSEFRIAVISIYFDQNIANVSA